MDDQQAHARQPSGYAGDLRLRDAKPAADLRLREIDARHDQPPSNAVAAADPASQDGGLDVGQGDGHGYAASAWALAAAARSA
jgi:hypothetical protein